MYSCEAREPDLWGPKRGLSLCLPASLSPTMALIKRLSKGKAKTVRGNPANWSINSADPPAHGERAQLPSPGGNVQNNCKRIKLQLQAGGGGYREPEGQDCRLVRGVSPPLPSITPLLSTFLSQAAAHRDKGTCVCV